MQTTPETLKKDERICGKKAISSLLSKGKWGVTGCIRFCQTPGEESFSRIMVAVPKRHFKRAVKRNLLKRRIREAYRRQKDLLQNGPKDILFFYNSTEICDFKTISADIASILQSL